MLPMMIIGQKGSILLTRFNFPVNKKLFMELR